MKKTLLTHLIRGLLAGLCALAPLAGASAQPIQGVVTDAFDAPLPGVNIVVKGTMTGVSSTANGSFTLDATPGDTLLFSYVGYVTQQVPVSGAALTSLLTVRLAEDVGQLNEVVVTAFGIEREQKALGYAVQKLTSADLEQAREINLVSALAGKAAGVLVSSNSAGPASSARIVIRGESSLDIDKNQPLFVVDGVPINNEVVGIGGSSTNQGDLPTDYGNGAAELNPDDIATVSILKGPNAAALYGSRAAGGVVLITTKKGTGVPGFSVSFNSTTTAEDVLRLPAYQNEFGGGVGGEFVCDWGYNWGPALDGQAIAQDCLVDEGRRTTTTAPFVAQPNTIENFFQTGTTYSNNIAVAGSNAQGSFRLSYTNLNNTGIVPNTGLDRNTLALNSGYALTDRLTVTASGNYVKSASDNLPTNGYGSQNIMYNFIWWYRNQDLGSFQNYWTPGAEEQQQDYYFTWADNPYLIVNEHTNALDRNRLFGNVAVNAELTAKWSLLLRTGIDYSDERRVSRRPMGSVEFREGMYREQEVGFTERNTEFLLNYATDLGSDWTLSVSAGGNAMRQESANNIIEGRSLGVPGVYNLGNIASQPALFQFDARRELNSLYGLGQMAWKERVFLEVTGRNDWSSTLPIDNNSYFYPSVSGSIVISEWVNLPAAFSFAKVRAGWAQVGNDTDPFRLERAYRFGTLPRTVTNPSLIPNPDLKPEITGSFEVGTDLRWFDNRVGLDATFYSSVSRNQILDIPLSLTTGFTRRVINAGEIRNRGVEGTLTITPIRNLTRRFSWDITLNAAANRSEVVELADGIETFVIAFGPDGNTVEARVGGRMGDLYGRTFLRVEDSASPFFGQIVYDGNGIPVLAEETRKIGNYNPDWMAGVGNGFRLGNVSLDVLFDIRRGGRIYSYTRATGSEGGILEHTLPGREGFGGLEYVDSQGNTRNDGIIGEGVVDNGEGSYRVNDIIVDARSYYTLYYRRDNIEANSFDASYVKLREVKLGYRIPRRLFGANSGIRSMRVSLVGRNLILWTDVPDIDPESFANNSGSLVPGFEVTQLPSTRSFGVNVNVEL